MTIEEKLIRDRGFTGNPSLADWMLTDGRLTNGSYEGHQRDFDHHDISEYFNQSKYEQLGSGSVYIRKFMRRGNIRMGVSDCAYTFQFEKLPTQAQLKRLVPNIIDYDTSGRQTVVQRARGSLQCHKILTMSGPEFFRYLSWFVYHDYGETLSRIDFRVMNYFVK